MAPPRKTSALPRLSRTRTVRRHADAEYDEDEDGQHLDGRGWAIEDEHYDSGDLAYDSGEVGSASLASSMASGSTSLTSPAGSLALGAGQEDATAPGTKKAAPALLTTLASADESVLSLAVDEVNGYIFGASQDGGIHVWSLSSFEPVTKLVGHTSSVLSLVLAPERKWLFSSSGDNSVRVWDCRRFGPAIYVVSPPNDNAGDVLSLSWNSEFGMLYLGCQDTSIQWTTLPLPPASPQYRTKPLDIPGAASAANHHGHDSFFSSTPPPISTPTSGGRGHHKFFDSLSQAELLKAARREQGRTRFHDPPSGSQSEGFNSPALGGNNGTFHDGTESPTRIRDSSLFGDGRSPDMDRVMALTSRLTTSTSRASSNAELQAIKDDAHGTEMLTLDKGNVIAYAHYGYVYCLATARFGGKSVLISGSGDGTIKIWPLVPGCGAPMQPALATLSSSTTSDEEAAVHALAVRQNTTLYAGEQGGAIKVWDLETLTCIRTLSGHRDDVLTMTVLPGGDLLSGCADGILTRWDGSFERVVSWNAHRGSALASAAARVDHKDVLLMTGGSDNCIKIWDVHSQEDDDTVDHEGLTFKSHMLRNLSKFVAFKSVSDGSHREDCRQAAMFLKKTLTLLGAHSKLASLGIPGAVDRNPLVLATFHGRAPPSGGGRRKKRVLFYGHYDVVKDGSAEQWDTEPFTMTGRDGYLYGRGVSDNKGPIMAVAYAASTLLDSRALDVDLIMLIEGEEEAGSAGFQEAVRKHKDAVGEVDVILISNSYWIGSETPCMTWGLRGVIHASVKVTSTQPDLHSGMQGGVVHEPVLDLVRVLASLVDDDRRISIPGFYDGVAPVTDEEDALYARIIQHFSGTSSKTLLKHSHVDDPRSHLITKWRTPALSVHKIDVSGPASSTIIPSSARSAVSIRIVPNQSLSLIADGLKSHVESVFRRLKSPNTLEVDICHTADWWLGDPTSPYSQAFVESIQAEWGVEPLWIREGGSIPGIPFLEREFAAKAVHFPMGQAGDAAHLPNERLRLLNLERGRNVIAKFLRHLSSINSPSSTPA